MIVEDEVRRQHTCGLIRNVLFGAFGNNQARGMRYAWRMRVCIGVSGLGLGCAQEFGEGFRRSCYAGFVGAAYCKQKSCKAHAARYMLLIRGLIVGATDVQEEGGLSEEMKEDVPGQAALRRVS